MSRRGRPARRALGAALTVAGLTGTALFGGVAPAQAQSGLEGVEALARQGRTEEARARLQGWWDEARSGASGLDRQRGTWLRAVLTVDPSQAALDFQRLVVEHPGGPFTDQALLRLGRAAEASGDLAEAARRFRTLVEDYPGSPARLEATSWLTGHGDAVAAAEREAALRAEIAAATAMLEAPAGGDGHTPPDGAAGDGVEVGAEDGGGDEAAEREGREAAPAPVEGEGAFTVQLGAFSTVDRARVLLRRAEDAGFSGRLVRVPGSGLVRVRVGRFPDARAAAALYERVRARGFEAAVSGDARREEPIT